MIVSRIVFAMLAILTVVCCCERSNAPASGQLKETKPTKPTQQKKPEPQREPERPAPAQRYGLDLAKRKQIFRSLVSLEDQADGWAQKKLLDSKGRVKPARAIVKLPAHLADPPRTVAAQYRISVEVVRKIGREGMEYNWSMPGD